VHDFRRLFTGIPAKFYRSLIVLLKRIVSAKQRAITLTEMLLRKFNVILFSIPTSKTAPSVEVEVDSMCTGCFCVKVLYSLCILLMGSIANLFDCMSSVVVIV